MPPPLAIWNPARDAWETEQISMLCGHSAVYSETWPTSGMTLAGSAYELPPWGLPTVVSGSSSSPDLLPTPTVVQGSPTPKAERASRGYGPQLEDISHLLPTPMAAGGDQIQPENWPGRTGAPGLGHRIHSLLPTPTASDHGGSTLHKGGNPTLPGAVTGVDESRQQYLLARLGRTSPTSDPTLFPTPVAGDAARAVNVPSSTRNPGLTLTEAVEGPLFPTPSPFHMSNSETPEGFRQRRLDVYQRTGTRHGPALQIIAVSIAEGEPMTPEDYMPDEDD